MTRSRRQTADERGYFDRVYEMVRRIPRGRVATYGQIAALLGNPRAARTVGWALHALPERSDVPWHRVVNAAGRISTSCREHSARLQAELLRREGVGVDRRLRLSLSRFRARDLCLPAVRLDADRRKPSRPRLPSAA